MNHLPDELAIPLYSELKLDLKNTIMTAVSDSMDKDQFSRIPATFDTLIREYRRAYLDGRIVHAEKWKKTDVYDALDSGYEVHFPFSKVLTVQGIPSSLDQDLHRSQVVQRHV